MHTHNIYPREKFLNQFIIGFTGRLAEQKNPLFLIDICEELLKKKEENFLFYIIGDGDLRPILEEKIQSKKLEKYFFCSGWSNQVEKEIHNFDTALMISKWEGFGLVVCEYMAAKIPVISVMAGGVKNILNPQNSFPIADYSATQFADQIIKIRYGSNQNIQEIIHNAYEDVNKKYSIEIMIKNLEHILNKF